MASLCVRFSADLPFTIGITKAGTLVLKRPQLRQQCYLFTHILVYNITLVTI